MMLTTIADRRRFAAREQLRLGRDPRREAMIPTNIALITLGVNMRAGWNTRQEYDVHELGARAQSQAQYRYIDWGCICCLGSNRVEH